jgi:hypothetical protein
MNSAAMGRYSQNFLLETFPDGNENILENIGDPVARQWP